MLITFEGLDNCGKTTIAERLEKNYKGRGFDCSYTREFETEVGKLIRRMEEKKQLDPILKSFLFAADRQLRTRAYSQEDYENKIIIFDRYYHSAIAYRMADGIERGWIECVNSVFRKPDYAFYIDITPEESVRRNTSSKFNIIYSVDKLRSIRDAYKSIFDDSEFIYIDGMRSIDLIYKDVLSKIECI